MTFYWVKSCVWYLYFYLSWKIEYFFPPLPITYSGEYNVSKLSKFCKLTLWHYLCGCCDVKHDSMWNVYSFRLPPSKIFRLNYRLKCYTIPSSLKEEQDLPVVSPTPSKPKSRRWHQGDNLPTAGAHQSSHLMPIPAHQERQPQSQT